MLDSPLFHLQLQLTDETSARWTDQVAGRNMRRLGRWCENDVDVSRSKEFPEPPEEIIHPITQAQTPVCAYPTLPT